MKRNLIRNHNTSDVGHKCTIKKVARQMKYLFSFFQQIIEKHFEKSNRNKDKTRYKWWFHKVFRDLWLAESRAYCRRKKRNRARMQSNREGSGKFSVILDPTNMHPEAAQGNSRCWNQSWMWGKGGGEGNEDSKPDSKQPNRANPFNILAFHNTI